MLTITELETLAVMLDSASRHMAQARTPAGEYAWGDAHPDSQLCDAIADMSIGFYQIQGFELGRQRVMIGA